MAPGNGVGVELGCPWVGHAAVAGEVALGQLWYRLQTHQLYDQAMAFQPLTNRAQSSLTDSKIGGLVRGPAHSLRHDARDLNLGLSLGLDLSLRFSFGHEHYFAGVVRFTIQQCDLRLDASA